MGFVAILGLVGLARLLFWVYCYLRNLFFLRPVPLIQKYGKKSWAVVTGASDGIGLGIAKRLAIEGFNMVIIARNQEKLETVKKDLLKINELIDVVVISADFSESNKADFFKKIDEKIRDLDVSVLVNNVGVLFSKDALQLSAKEIRDTIVVNCCSQVGMDKLLIPKMQKRSTRCAVIDLSSMATMTPLYLHGVYGATKCINEYICQGLSSYVKNVDFLCVNPGFVSTNMTLNREAGKGFASTATVSVNDCVDGIFNSLGSIKQT